LLLKLALAHGGEAILDPDAFRESMPNDVFDEWAQLYSIDPWDGERLDLLFGILCSITAEVWRDKEKHKLAFLPKDFMPDWMGDTANKEESETNVADNIDQWVACLRAVRLARHGHNHR
jgi:hypothetical protein